MTWGKIDDQLHSHPKAIRAGLEAMGLWVMSLSHCCAYLTDGHVTLEAASRIAGSRESANRLAERLCLAGLWDTDDGGDGWRFHDYLDHQPSRKDVVEKRELQRSGGRLGAQKRWSHGKDGSSQKKTGTPTGNDGSTHGQTQSDLHTPVPSRPVPSQEGEEPQVHAARKPEASPLRRRPPGVVAHEHTFLIAAYERAAGGALGHAFGIDTEEYGIEKRLDTIVSAHCPNPANAQPWLEEVVASFVRATRRDPKSKGYGPKALLEWLNGGGWKPKSAQRPAPTPAQQADPTASPAENLTVSSPHVREGLDKILAAMKGSGDGT